SAAIAALVKMIVQNAQKPMGVCTLLRGEYGLNDICIGVPCVIGRSGIEKVIELDLNPEENNRFHDSACKLRQHILEIT
ncbi:MAG: malate dehydrogenase, partial [Candidatus Omnitrophica bacterium]|nr:malate dehydrogenase [Candidatus Omnitrophota bacterium]